MNTLMRSRNLCLSLSSLCLLAATEPAIAEDWQYSLKAGVANAPRYSGSDERMTAPVLGGKVVSPWGIFLDTDKGLGWGYEGNAGLEAVLPLLGNGRLGCSQQAQRGKGQA